MSAKCVGSAQHEIERPKQKLRAPTQWQKLLQNNHNAGHNAR